MVKGHECRGCRGGAFSHFIKSGRAPSSGCSSKTLGLVVAPHRTAPHGKLIHGVAGLFTCEDVEEGTVVAGFGAVGQLREGEEGTRTRLGYRFIVKEREGKSLTITPKHGVTEGCMAHAINHTCHPGFANCRFVHAGIVGGWSEDEQGGIGGRRTSEVFVKTTKRVESDTELFANYGTKFRFPGVCVCHLCRPLEP